MAYTPLPYQHLKQVRTLVLLHSMPAADLLSVQNDVREDTDHDCRGNCQPTTTRNDIRQFQHRSATPMGTVKSTRGSRGNSSERENSSNTSVNSAVVNSIAAKSHKSRKAIRRSSGSPAALRTKKLKTTMERAQCRGEEGAAE